ncbi:MAG: hypothetical protein CMM50_11455, partial [Rhodospirillaceae bacterium]|nr:hypothetical protein [Rhodospirillaceae bacterium]
MRILLLAVALVVAAGGYTTYWFVLRARAESAVEDWVAAQRRSGTEITYRSFEIGGFPYRLEADIQGLSVARGEAAVPWSWQSDRVLLITQPWSLRHFVAVTDAPSQLAYWFGGIEYRVNVALSEGRASTRVDGNGQLAMGAVDLRDLRLTDGDDAMSLGSIGRFQVHVRPGAEETENTFDAVLQADGVDLPGSGPAALGNRVEHVLVDASWSGPLPDADFAEAVAAWREAGGAVDVHALTVDWGPLGVDGDATLSVDDAMRPLGAGVVRVAGSDALVDALSAEGNIDGTMAAAAKIGLALIAKRPPDG